MNRVPQTKLPLGTEATFDSQLFEVPSRIIVAGKSTTAKTFSSLFKDSKHLILPVGTGEEVLRLVRDGNVDLIVLEASLPKISGFEVCRRLKIDPEWQYIPIVLLTSSVNPKSQAQGFECGANDVIPKPINATLLQSRIRSILKYRHVVAALREAHAELEQRVLERTLELSHANEDLKTEIQERRLTEEALRESEIKFRCVAQSASDAIISANSQLNIVFMNAGACRMFGFKEEEILERPWALLFPEPFRKPLRQSIEKLKASGQGEAIGSTVEWRGLKKGGIEFPIEISLGTWEVGGRTFFSGVIRDIAGRKETELQVQAQQTRLRKITSQLALSEERERRQFASVLHDSIGQDLSYTRFKLREFRAGAPNEEWKGPIEEVLGVVEKMIVGVRSLTFELSTPILYEIGLESALEWLAENTTKRYGLPCTLDVKGPEMELDTEKRVLLFQAAREIVHNAVKHAKANELAMVVTRGKKQWRIEVLDDGVGIQLPRSGRIPRADSGGYGLFSLRERLQYLGGSLRLSPRIQGGTHVSIQLQIEKGAEPS